MNVLEYMKDHVLCLDGGMGTMLQARGLQPGELPETWNTARPEEVTAIHRAYFDAGANVVCANTFGANRLKFGRDELEALIRAAVAAARKAAETSTGAQEKFVALDLGPCGRLLKPYGDLDFEDAVEIYAETVRIGAAAGADLVMIETMNDSLDTKAAVLAVKENCALPLFVSNAYGADGKLMTGASPEAMTAMLEGLGADVIGMNCSLGPEAMAETAERYLASASVPVMLKPNAGLPRVEDGKTVYDVGPEAFAAAMKPLLEKGLGAAGGCCGTTPEYIRLLSGLAAGMKPARRETARRTVAASYTHAVTLGEAPVLIGERINPTGKKRFREALQNGDIAYVLGEAVRQQEAGAHMLDVNVGAPGIDEKAVLVQVMEEVQAVCDLPLQLDTADPAAMEAALRRYNGKAMINSVNGKRESMEAVFPAAKKYGGVVVALTLDENGIPDTAEGRVAIARKILDAALAAGLRKEDLVFDPLTMAVSADPDAARVTLEALRRIRGELGCPAVLGVSNISFGLPQRELIGSAFFLQALAAGLSAAIMNPCAAGMMTAYRSYAALNGLDPQCASYIEYVTALPEAAPAAAGARPAPAAEKAEGSPLRRAVTKGLKSEAAALAGELLSQGADPMRLVQEDIIPALNTVGDGFEKKTMFLPQLMMSAEAADAAFRKIRDAARTGKPQPSRMTVVLATVKGDIHDIGKNIVRLLLENYGFTVIDLGKDVPPERIVDAALERGAPVIGLSALMTTTVPAMEETIRLAREKAPGVKVMVGGAVLTQAYADSIRADGYSPDAMGAVRFCERVEAELKKG